MSLAIVQGSGNSRRVLEGKEAYDAVNLFRKQCPRNPYKIAKHIQQKQVYVSRQRSIVGKRGLVKMVGARPLEQRVIKHYLHGAVAVSSGDIY